MNINESDMKKHNVVILEDDRVLAELIRKRVNDIDASNRSIVSRTR